MSRTPGSSDKPLRYSCDRCHSLKVRCPRSVIADKTTFDQPCLRCLKAGVGCVSSIQRKVGRPSKAAKKKPRDRVLEMEAPRQDSGGAVGVVDGEMQQPSTGDSQADILQLGPDSMLHEWFPMDFDIDADIPAFFFSSDSPTAIEAAGEMADDTGTLDEILKHQSKTDSPAISEYPDKHTPSDSLFQFSTVITTKDTFPATSPASSFSSTTAYYRKLSELSVKILASSEGKNDAIDWARILKDVIGFSEELFDTARRTLPSFFGLSPLSSRGSTISQADSSLTFDDNETSIDNTFSSKPIKTDDWMSNGPRSKTHCVPQSAVIFSLLGCYTQILYLCEMTIDGLWADLEADKAENASTFKFLLEASLAVQSVTYLLGRLRRAFSVPEMENNGHGKSPDHTGDLHVWHGSFVGGNELEDGLLGQAFAEMRDREEQLMRRTHHLQEKIVNS
ncbi:hypothetical protein QQX98_010814 [Neonectria punicea]|uniref:Zn(2)-C6 fungal-type domain-containing protein n=1 Tax=Neonectria punicea TaxID=979145 RepID=A0ABR1GNG4_9HYPO